VASLPGWFEVRAVDETRMSLAKMTTDFEINRRRGL
jgi:hypothetical protein